MPQSERPEQQGGATPEHPGATTPEPGVYSISDARPSLDDEMRHRMRRYLISMSVRTVCFILAVVLHGWLRWSFAAAAIVLPYVAVVMANAGPRKRTRPAEPYSPPRQSLEDDRRHEIGPPR